ncbi:MAG: hypothetical protein K6G88_03065 [Lachnospiraceae bacterium]|nr:hypothetical protein [Lachnospiraceae bacterium]
MKSIIKKALLTLFIIVTIFIFVAIIAIFSLYIKYEVNFEVLQKNYYVNSNVDNYCCVVKNRKLHFINNLGDKTYSLSTRGRSKNPFILKEEGENTEERYDKEIVRKRPTALWGLTKGKRIFSLSLTSGDWPVNCEEIKFERVNPLAGELFFSNILEFTYNNINISFSYIGKDIKAKIIDDDDIITYDVIINEDNNKISITDGDTIIMNGNVLLDENIIVLSISTNSLGIPEGEKLKFDTLECE